MYVSNSWAKKIILTSIRLGILIQVFSSNDVVIFLHDVGGFLLFFFFRVWTTELELTKIWLNRLS